MFLSERTRIYAQIEGVVFDRSQGKSSVFQEKWLNQCVSRSLSTLSSEYFYLLTKYEAKSPAKGKEDREVEEA